MENKLALMGMPGSLPRPGTRPPEGGRCARRFAPTRGAETAGREGLAKERPRFPGRKDPVRDVLDTPGAEGPGRDRAGAQGARSRPGKCR